MTTAGASNIGQAGATLSASYSGATATPREVRFEYGTSSGSLDQTVYYNDGGLSAPSGSFSVDVTSLNPGTTYYYRAVIQVGSSDYYGEVKSFTTTSETQQTGNPGWLELPAAKTGSNLVSGTLSSGSNRNYSYLYDKGMYASLWSAYPLTSSHTSGSASSTTWSFNPQISSTYQVNVVSHSYETQYGAEQYSRGHMVPAADRKCDNTMRSQTYYVTNQTPQFQDKFNAGVWSALENAIRGLTSSADTVYVITGPVYQTVGGNETVTYLNASSGVTPSRLPVPNYFWKAVLKVKRSGGTVTSASAIGFWFDHKEYNSGESYQQHIVSIDTIEQMTGLDLFANLPDSIEASVESQTTSWSSFQSF